MNQMPGQPQPPSRGFRAQRNRNKSDGSQQHGGRLHDRAVVQVPFPAGGGPLNQSNPFDAVSHDMGNSHSNSQRKTQTLWAHGPLQRPACLRATGGAASP